MLELITPSELQLSESQHTQVLDALDKVYQDCSVYQRLDALIELVEACRAANSTSDVLQELLHNTLEMINLICDSNDADDATNKRKLFRAIDQDYLPNHITEHLSSAEICQTREEFLAKRTRELFVNKRNYLFLSKKDQNNLN